MIKIPNRFYTVDEEGFSRMTIVKEYIGPETELLQHFAARTPRVLVNFIDNCSLAISQATAAIATELSELKMTTQFRPMTELDASVSLIPVWIKPGTEMTFMWTPPESMRLFFILIWDIGTNRSVRGITPRAYLIAVHRESKKTYLLPLPNLYDDGRICLGHDHVSIRAVGDIKGQMDAALKVFRDSPWNSDLINHSVGRVDAVRFLFRFNPDGKQLPPLRDWTELSRIINHTAYQFVSTL